MEHKLLVSLERKKKRTARKLKDWLVKQREVLEERVAAPCFPTTAVHYAAAGWRAFLSVGWRVVVRNAPRHTAHSAPHACLPSRPTLSTVARRNAEPIALTSARRASRVPERRRI